MLPVTALNDSSVSYNIPCLPRLFEFEWEWEGGEVGWGGGGCLFEAGGLLAFSAFRMGAYSRWALIQGWAPIRINTVL